MIHSISETFACSHENPRLIPADFGLRNALYAVSPAMLSGAAILSDFFHTHLSNAVFLSSSACFRVRQNPSPFSFIPEKISIFPSDSRTQKSYIFLTNLPVIYCTSNGGNCHDTLRVIRETL